MITTPPTIGTTATTAMTVMIATAAWKDTIRVTDTIRTTGTSATRNTGLRPDLIRRHETHARKSLGTASVALPGMMSTARGSTTSHSALQARVFLPPTATRHHLRLGRRHVVRSAMPVR